MDIPFHWIKIIAQLFIVSIFREGHGHVTLGGRRTRPTTNMITKSTIKMKKRILAIPAVAAAISKKPNTPAIIEIIKNTRAQ
jgi:hypothetical protein